MSNHVRSIKSDLWIDGSFRKFDVSQKVVWFYLHTGYHSSETALYSCPIDDIALFCSISKKKTASIIKDFIDMGIVDYDFDTEEILVKDYYDQHSPTSGLFFYMYLQDLEKIKSKKLIDGVIEMSKKYRISTAFYLALTEVRPDLKREDFKIIKTDKSDEEIRNAGLRGRTIALENKKASSEASTPIANNDEQNIDPDLPF